MQTIEPQKISTTGEEIHKKVLELTVNNHPGVMSHVCSLFSRRAYNMDGILCIPVGDGKMSRIWIRIDSNGQLNQIVKQLQKLEDVQEVRYHSPEDDIAGVEDYFKVS